MNPQILENCKRESEILEKDYSISNNQRSSAQLPRICLKLLKIINNEYLKWYLFNFCFIYQVFSNFKKMQF